MEKKIIFNIRKKKPCKLLDNTFLHRLKKNNISSNNNKNNHGILYYKINSTNISRKIVLS